MFNIINIPFLIFSVSTTNSKLCTADCIGFRESYSQIFASVCEIQKYNSYPEIDLLQNVLALFHKPQLHCDVTLETLGLKNCNK